MTTKMIRQILFCILVLTATAKLGYVQGRQQMHPQPQINASSEVFAAFLVAYEADRKWWKDKSVDLNPREFIARHWAVHVSQEQPDRVSVLFLPASSAIRGGGVEYVVDIKKLQIIDVIFER